jgi:DNA-binding HxlR family transcriptional regulator
LRSLCPVACSLDVVGDRWTLLVIRDLLGGKRRFGDFLAAPEHIPTNILAERLKRLEAAGLVQAVPYSERPRRSEYCLTERGRALGPVLDAIASWGLEQFPGTRLPARLRSRSMPPAPRDQAPRPLDVGSQNLVQRVDAPIQPDYQP